MMLVVLNHSSIMDCFFLEVIFQSHHSWCGLDLISGLCFTLVSTSPDHMYKWTHLKLSTVHWVTPELSEWFLRLLGPLICHLR